MPKGAILYYDRDTGVGRIKPNSDGPSVRFLGTVVQGDKKLLVPSAPVDYELYENGGAPEAKRVVVPAA